MEKTSILEMAGGKFMELADREIGKIVENIVDGAAEQGAKRKLQITLEFRPFESGLIRVTAKAKTTLAPPLSEGTSLYLSEDTATGEMKIYELEPEVKGQMNMEEQAPELRVL